MEHGNAINHISYKSSLSGEQTFSSPELDVIQDADRLDAIGAIGIARCFNYGGFKNRTLYDPNIAPNLHMSKEAYKSSSAPTINHFYEKLLLLKDKMNTQTGKRIASIFIPELRHLGLDKPMLQGFSAMDTMRDQGIQRHQNVLNRISDNSAILGKLRQAQDMAQPYMS